MAHKLTKEELLTIAQEYGVQGINFSGCISSQSNGYTGAMRRRAHAHNSPTDKWFGWICFLSHTPTKRAIKDNKPTMIFWHEVGHIYRRSWSEKQCDLWAWKQIRTNINLKPTNDQKPARMTRSGGE